MKRLIKIAFSLFLSLEALAAPGLRDVYPEADRLYRESRWAEAVSLCLEGLAQPGLPESEAVELHSVLGAAYARLGAFGKAAEYMKKCYDYDLAQGEVKGLTSSLINLASMYVYAGVPEEGESYALKAIENEEKVGRPAYLAKAYGKACDVYHAIGKDEVALEYADRAVATAEKDLDEVQASIRRSQRAYALSGLGRHDDAIADLEVAEKVFRDNNARQSLSVVCFQKAQEYGLRSNIEDEVKYLQEAHLLASEMRDLPLLQKITDYEIERRARTVDLQNAKIIEDRRERRGLIVVILLLVSAAAVTAVSLKRTRRSERLLAEACEKKDWLLRVLSHDLRSPQQAQLTGLRMLRRSYDSLSPKDAKESLSQMEMVSASELEHMDNVLSWARREAKVQPVRFELSDLVREAVRQYARAAELKGVTLEAETPSGVFVNSDRGNIALALRNLLSNAVKFSNAGGKVTVSVENGPEGVRVIVSDEGVGMAPENLEKLFQNRPVDRKPGTAGEPSHGLGLSVTKTLIEDAGCFLEAESKLGEGASFTIKFPV